MNKGKLIIFAAPSGSGKSTIVNYIMHAFNDPVESDNPTTEDCTTTDNSTTSIPSQGGGRGRLHFSISATSRAPRGTEQNGVEYFFMTPEEFRAHIDAGDFIEYEEVYTDKFYGTLKSQVDKQLEAGENVIFDVDVKGALNIKKQYGKQALAMFIQPPSLAELRRRLEGRGTDAPDVIEQRLAKAEYELSFADKFDEIIINDVLEVAEVEAEALVEDFIETPL